MLSVILPAVSLYAPIARCRCSAYTWPPLAQPAFVPSCLRWPLLPRGFCSCSHPLRTGATFLNFAEKCAKHKRRLQPRASRVRLLHFRTWSRRKRESTGLRAAMQPKTPKTAGSTAVIPVPKTAGTVPATPGMLMSAPGTAATGLSFGATNALHETAQELEAAARRPHQMPFANKGVPPDLGGPRDKPDAAHASITRAPSVGGAGSGANVGFGSAAAAVTAAVAFGRAPSFGRAGSGSSFGRVGSGETGPRRRSRRTRAEDATGQIHTVKVRNEEGRPSVSNTYVEHTFSNGDTYKGFWYRGMLTGEGMYSKPVADGHKQVEIYQGMWQNDVLSGEGQHDEPGGRVYEGQFKDGWRHGRGRLHIVSKEV